MRPNRNIYLNNLKVDNIVGVVPSSGGGGGTIVDGEPFNDFDGAVIYTFVPDTKKSRQFINFDLYDYNTSSVHYFTGNIDVNSNFEGTLSIVSQSSNYSGSEFVDTPTVSNAGGNIYLKQGLKPVGVYPIIEITVPVYCVIRAIGSALVPGITITGIDLTFNPDVIGGDYLIQLVVTDGLNIKWKLLAEKVVTYQITYGRTITNFRKIVYDFGGINEAEVNNEFLYNNFAYFVISSGVPVYLSNLQIYDSVIPEFSTKLEYKTIY